MTPYRERREAGEYDPETTPGQPKDVRFTDKKFLEKTGVQVPPVAGAPKVKAKT